MEEVTVESLRTAEFDKLWRGYSDVQVDELLNRTAFTLQGLHERVRDLTAKLEKAESRGGYDNDATVKRTLVLAQRAADLVISEAKAVAERIIDDARKESERILADSHSGARLKAQQLTAEFDREHSERKETAEREHALFLSRLSLEAGSAEQEAKIALTKSQEMQAQTLAMRDRLRSILTDQMVRLDRLVEEPSQETVG